MKQFIALLPVLALFCVIPAARATTSTTDGAGHMTGGSGTLDDGS